MQSQLGRGLAVGLIASLALAAGLAMMKSRGEALPAAEGTNIPHVLLRWIRDPVWLAGLGVESAGYILYFAALAYAPVSLVAVMMQGGIAAFVIVAVIFLHERANTGEAAGIAGVLLAMVLLALSLGAESSQGEIDSNALAVVSAGSLFAAATPWIIPRLRGNGTAPAIASGVAFGLGSLYTKAMAEICANHSGSLIISNLAASPWPYLMVAANLAGLVLLQNSFHWARGIIAMPLSSAVSNLVPIVGGILAFGEELPSDRASAVLRVAAFALTILSGVLMASVEVPTPEVGR